jgi:hypothetical protein
MNSIKEYGFSVPIAISGKNNLIVSGHGRWIAAKKLGIKEIPCIRLDDLSDEQLRAYRLADNSVRMMTGFDFDKLNSDIESLLNFKKEDFGFGFAPKDELEEFNQGDSDGGSRGHGKKSSGGSGKANMQKPVQYRCPGCGHTFNPAYEDAVNENRIPVEDCLDEALKEIV